MPWFPEGDTSEELWFDERLTMSMTVYSQTTDSESAIPGEWTTTQDESGEIIRTWKPVDTDADVADIQEYRIPCQARTPLSSGVSALGVGTEYGDRILITEFIRVFFPKGYRVTLNDRVTDIRDSQGEIVYIDEEYPDAPSGEAEFKATMFNVEGVTPVLDWNNNLVEWSAVLMRAK